MGRGAFKTFVICNRLRTDNGGLEVLNYKWTSQTRFLCKSEHPYFAPTDFKRFLIENSYGLLSNLHTYLLSFEVFLISISFVFTMNIGKFRHKQHDLREHRNPEFNQDCNHQHTKLYCKRTCFIFCHRNEKLV